MSDRLAAATLLVDALPLGRAKRVVDLAVGDGLLLPLLRRAAPSAVIVGVDTRARLVPGGDVPLAVTDAAALGLATRAFDAGVLAFALAGRPDLDAVLREARRVVRRGGVLGLAEVGNPLSLRAALERAGFASVRVWCERTDRERASTEVSFATAT